MNLQPIYPQKPIFFFNCFLCGKPGNSTTGKADLMGPAFKAFYCLNCAKTLGGSK